MLLIELSIKVNAIIFFEIYSFNGEISSILLYPNNIYFKFGNWNLLIGSIDVIFFFFNYKDYNN